MAVGGTLVKTRMNGKTLCDSDFLICVSEDVPEYDGGFLPHFKLLSPGNRSLGLTSPASSLRENKKTQIQVVTSL